MTKANRKDKRDVLCSGEKKIDIRRAEGSRSRTYQKFEDKLNKKCEQELDTKEFQNNDIITANP